MENSKLVGILKKFNPAEIERLKAFMVSPYFIKQQSLVRFAEIILNEYPHFQSDKVNEKTIYDLMYVGQKFQPSTINDLMTLMTSSLLNFLAFENFIRDEFEHNLRLIEELRERDFSKEFLRFGAKLRKKLDSGKKDQDYYNNLSKLENEMDHFYVQKEHRGFSQNLQNKADSFDFYFIAAKLKMICEIINRQNIFASKYQIEFLDEVLDYISSNITKFENTPAIFIYYKIILTLIKPEEEENFHDLKVLLENAHEVFKLTELKDMYGYAQNYCIKKINSGQFNYVSELFGLYRKQLDGKIIFENGLLSQWDFKNIVTIGLRLNEFDWTENFILSYKNQIHPDFREVAYAHNMAYLYYEKKDYKQALKMLNEFNNEIRGISDPGFDDTFYNLDSRSLLLKIYYEQEDEEPFYAIIDSFRLFLRRNKRVSDRQRNNYLNLIKYTKKLNDFRQKIELGSLKDKKPLSELEDRINSEKNIVNLTWLQNQIEEIEKDIKS